MGTVTIKQLDAGGIGELAGTGDLKIEGAVSNTKIHSTWTLKNSFLKSVKFGELDYTSEDIISIDLGLTYDYATYEDHGPSGVTLL